YAACCHCNAGIRRAVVEMDRISIGADDLPAGEHNVLDIAIALIRGLRAKHPGVSSPQANFRPFQIKERKAQAINTSRSGSADPVIDRKPTLRGLDRGRA